MQISCKSDIGRMRSQNQDSVFASDKPVGKLPNLLIVADGMGGHKAGDFASRFKFPRGYRKGQIAQRRCFSFHGVIGQ